MNILDLVNKHFPVRLQIEVVEENENFLIIDKPVGMVVNRAISHKGYTVQDWMRDRYKDKFKMQKSEFKIEENVVEIPRDSHALKNELENLRNFSTAQNDIESGEEVNWDEVNYNLFWERNGVVHRLDKETGGVMILAKTPEEYVRLLSLFRERKVKKTYLALVHGLVNDDEGVIDQPLGRLPWNRTRFGVLAGGREAVTKYKVLERWQKVKPTPDAMAEDFSLVELHPQTGRTHQIRVHLLSIGHPIVGDPVYAGRKLIKQDEKWCGRMCLRAVRVEMENSSD